MSCFIVLYVTNYLTVFHTLLYVQLSFWQSFQQLLRLLMTVTLPCSCNNHHIQTPTDVHSLTKCRAVITQQIQWLFPSQFSSFPLSLSFLCFMAAYLSWICHINAMLWWTQWLFPSSFSPSPLSSAFLGSIAAYLLYTGNTVYAWHFASTLQAFQNLIKTFSNH